MPSTKSDQLINLINSLTKAEKRNFKLFVKRLQSNKNVMFVQLFDILERVTEYDESLVLSKMEGLTKDQLSNLKRHLYAQILKSLRLIQSDKYVDIQLREQLDHARILYEKGLYLQALRLLERARPKADSVEMHVLHLEIVEFIKFIEERHITRSRRIAGKMEKLLHEADVLERGISNIVRLSNLKIRIHGLYITMGHARDQKDHWMVTEYFHSELEKINEDTLTVIERIFLHQSYMWYFYILLDFEKCYEHAVKWIDIFDENPELKSDDPVLYMRGLSYVLASLFSMRRYREYVIELARFESFSKQFSKNFGTTQSIIHFMYLNTARINKHMLEGSFREGVKLIPEIERLIKEYHNHLDIHRIMVFNYKMAWLFFGAGDYDRCIEYLNSIIMLRAAHLREDIQCYARLLHLMAHYELGHDDLLPYMVDSVSRFFGKMKDLNEVQKTILDYFRRNVATTSPRLASRKKLKKDLLRLSEKPYERRAFLHLDMLAWIDSKISGKSLSQTIRERFIKSGS
jgi:tetratricopeptide (TPR) repeat protein